MIHHSLVMFSLQEIWIMIQCTSGNLDNDPVHLSHVFFSLQEIWIMIHLIQTLIVTIQNLLLSIQLTPFFPSGTKAASKVY